MSQDNKSSFWGVLALLVLFFVCMFVFCQLADWFLEKQMGPYYWMEAPMGLIYPVVTFVPFTLVLIMLIRREDKRLAAQTKAE